MAKVREGVVLGGLSGRTGNAVFVQTQNGTVLRDRPFVNDPNTPAQFAVRERMRRVSMAWRGMSLGQAGAWKGFAAEFDQGPAQQLFCRLGTKFLQMNPNSPVPMNPPSGIFPGDAVRFSVVALGGGVVVSGNRANAPGVMTEVLVQRLNSVHCRTYLQRYRSAGFYQFNSTGIPLTLTPGTWAIATRFIDAQTGQMTTLIECGVVVV